MHRPESFQLGSWQGQVWRGETLQQVEDQEGNDEVVLGLRSDVFSSFGRTQCLERRCLWSALAGDCRSTGGAAGRAVGNVAAGCSIARTGRSLLDCLMTASGDLQLEAGMMMEQDALAARVRAGVAAAIWVLQEKGK